jgi:dynein heavy chain
MDDLLERTGFIAKWIECGPPPAFWISGFFFPQAFLTGTLQNHARARGIAIDTVSFAFEIMDDVDPAEGSGAKPPSTGCYVYGMHLEGARWDTGLKSLAESRPKELFTELPVVWLRPEQNRTKPTSGSYDCPVYKTLERKGTLSTTGHSTNYVMSIEMPTTSRDASHWTRRGVALFTALAR